MLRRLRLDDEQLRRVLVAIGHLLGDKAALGAVQEELRFSRAMLDVDRDGEGRMSRSRRRRSGRATES